jgi:hypothetical protein
MELKEFQILSGLRTPETQRGGTPKYLALRSVQYFDVSTSYISSVRGATQENLREREVRSMTSYVATATPMRRNKTPI